mmetsp:Transcript_24868/g.36681  ORF Transcript_24868/g.36681 Transcript_24868/m.36681 type:complete len:80 (+) Transcript_24868:132-371(+)
MSTVINAAVGALCGMGIRMFSNALHKQRYLYQPWLMIAHIGVGAYVGYNYNNWEDSLYEEVNQRRVELGYRPLERKQTP